jgi:tetratricopeptide (TPR) repeat protein
MAGEKASQNRANEIHKTFLDSSKQTLDLVNATLQLAKDASERAVKSVEANAISVRQQLDQEAKEILTKVPEHDDGALVVNQARRSELISLAHKIAGFEINQLILPTPITLTPHCSFVRGMELHLRQQFDDALKYWQEVALRDDSPDPLKSLAWYWTGIEQNSLARFSEAEQSFYLAGETVTGIRELEIQRIRLESRFCDKEKVQASALIRPLKELLSKAQMMDNAQQVEARKAKIMVTLSNVMHQAGNDCQRDGLVDEAMAYYEAALKIFKQVDRKDKWALFGRAEALYALERLDETYQIYRGPLRSYAIEEYLGRIEPRTKVLGRTMKLICCVRVPDLRSDITAAYRNTIEALGQVDERLTVYSQLQRRNIRQPEFRAELDQLIHM